MYLNRNTIMSYNCALNFIVLKRGYGKTFTFKKAVIDDFIKHGHQFVWIRRYKEEVTNTIKTFIDQIQNEYPNDKLEIKGKEMYINGKLAGYFISLSSCQKFKSGAYPKVKKTIFDEFVCEGSVRYLPDECDMFCSLLSTIYRDRRMYVYCLGNKVKVLNMYNVYFNICNYDGIKVYPDRSILVYASDRDNIVEKNYQKSDLEKVLRGTNYYDYNFSNTSLTDTSDFVRPMSDTCRLCGVVNINGIDVGIFLDTVNSAFWFNTKCDSTHKMRFTFDKEHPKESYMILCKSFPLSKLLVDFYRRGSIYYNDSRSKSLALELLSCLS